MFSTSNSSYENGPKFHKMSSNQAPRLWHCSSLKNSTATPIDPSPLALLSPLPTLALPSRSRVTEKCSKMSNFPENPEEICKHHQPSSIESTCALENAGRLTIVQCQRKRLVEASAGTFAVHFPLLGAACAPRCGHSGFPSR